MYVESFKNNGIPYLRLVRNDRVINKKGIKTSTKTVVLNIGPLSRFDDGLPEFVIHSFTISQQKKNWLRVFPLCQLFFFPILIQMP